MLTIGDRFPTFSLQAVLADKSFATVTDESYAGDWKVVFFWPMDFTFICPTELQAFGAAHDDFRARGATLLGASTDTHFVHLAWRDQHPGLAELPYPMLADTKRELTTALGILDKQEGVALRATYIVDPEGVIRHVSVNDLNVGRSVHEVLRILDALQTDELTPCGWTPGEATLGAA